MRSKWRVKTERNGEVHYSGDELWSRNAVISMAVGGRSIGKTYWGKGKFIEKFIEGGEQWVYLRRHANQLDEFRKDSGAKLLADISKEFPHHEMRVKGDLIQIRLRVDEDEKVKNQWRTMGYLMALTSNMQYKGTSYDDVRYILFDEFIREARNRTVDRYLTDEVGTLFSVINTIDRMRDVVRVYMTANAGDLTNPYFMTWGIGKPKEGFTRYQHGTVCLQYGGATKAFTDQAKASRFAKLIEGTSYGSFALENKFINDTPEFIERKPPTAKCYNALAYMGRTYGIWRDASSGNYYVTDGAPADAKVYGLLRSDMRPNMVLLKRSEGWLRNLADIYRYGMMFFDSPTSKAAVTELLGLLGIM